MFLNLGSNLGHTLGTTTPSGALYMHHRQIVELAARHRIPASYVEKGFVLTG